MCGPHNVKPPGRTFLRLPIRAQPDDTTCGPTCLQSLYRYWADPISLDTVIDEVEALEGGGTLAVLLGLHALSRGYRATIYTCNLHVFDPSWFKSEKTDLSAKLRAQQAAKHDDERLVHASDAYLRFLANGGQVRYEEISGKLIRRHLNRRVPLLAGLSATYLYNCPRELNDENDDIRGTPLGHFVLLDGYEMSRRRVHVLDPYRENPAFRRHHYWVDMSRLVVAIHLGIVTYDANLLVIERPKGRSSK